MVFDENGKDLHMDKTEIRPYSDLDKDPAACLTRPKKRKHKIYIPKQPPKLIQHGVLSILTALFFLFVSPDMYLVKIAIGSNFIIPADSIMDFIVLNLVHRGKIAEVCLTNSAKMTNKYRWINAILTVIASICIIADQSDPAIAISSIIIMLIQIIYAQEKWN